MTSIRPGFIIRCFSNGFNRLVSVTHTEQRKAELLQNLFVSLSSLINHLKTNFIPTQGGRERRREVWTEEGNEGGSRRTQRGSVSVSAEGRNEGDGAGRRTRKDAMEG